MAEKRVEILNGSSIPDQGGFKEPEINAKVGDTIVWDNKDTAAHTVTSGTPKEGPDGKFDSSLFMSGSTFTASMKEEGEIDYFCMVHPWKKGKIIVS